MGGGQTRRIEIGVARGKGEGEGDAFRAGGDDIDALTVVLGKGWAKSKGAIPLRSPWPGG